MMNLQSFLTALFAVSAITSLTTEAVKKALDDRNKTYHTNTLTGIIALIISSASGIGYTFVSGIGFTPSTVVSIVGFAFMSWLCAMVGYDKIAQTIGQFKTTKEDETDG